MSTARVRVKRDGPLPERPWRAMVRDAATDTLVGYYPSMPQAVTTGITAARFLAAGITWTPEGVPALDGDL